MQRASFGRGGPAGLLRRLPRDSAPALCTFLSGRRQVRVGPPRNHRYKAVHAEFRTLFDGPLHAVKFVDRQHQDHRRKHRCSDLFAKRKFNSLRTHAEDIASAHKTVGHDFKFLAGLCSQYAHQMIGVAPSEPSPICGGFIGNPTASSHQLNGCICSC